MFGQNILLCNCYILTDKGVINIYWVGGSNFLPTLPKKFWSPYLGAKTIQKLPLSRFNKVMAPSCAHQKFNINQR